MSQLGQINYDPADHSKEHLRASKRLTKEWLDQLDVSPSSKKTMERNISLFWDWYAEQKKQGMRKKMSECIKLYRDWLLYVKKLSPYTVKNYLTTLKIYFDWMEQKANDEGYLPYVNPTKGLKMPKTSQGHTKQPLTIAHIKAMLNLFEGKKDLISLRNRAILAILATTGMRVNSVRMARIKDFRPLSDGRMALYYLSKGRSAYDSYVPVSNQVIELIREYLDARREVEGIPDQDAWLFTSSGPNRPPGQLSQRTISVMVKNCLRDIGIDDPAFTAHSLRHGFATNNVLLGGSLEGSMLALGHSSMAQTLAYTHDLGKIQNDSTDRINQAIFGSEQKTRSAAPNRHLQAEEEEVDDE